MQQYRLEDFTNGWVIGNFVPSVVRTKAFEVGVKKHVKHELWPAHTHQSMNEINILLHGRMRVNGLEIPEGTIFVIDSTQRCVPVFLEDCELVCIKIPSVPGDKTLCTSSSLWAAVEDVSYAKDILPPNRSCP